MFAMVVLRGMKHPQISQVFLSSQKRSQLSQMAMRSAATALGATVGSSSNLRAVSFIEAAKLLLQHSGASSMVNPSKTAKLADAKVLSHFQVCGKPMVDARYPDRIQAPG